MTTNEAPQGLDVAHLAQTGEALAGTQLLSDYERLAKACQEPAPDLRLNWQAVGEYRALASGGRYPALHLRADAVLPLVCQRCLGVTQVAVAVDRHFVFLPDEATAAALDGQEEDELLALSRRLDLHALIEDEMLLALPMVPAHGNCPAPVKMSAQDSGFGTLGALGALKRH